jgi:hypothetical protein
MIVSFLFIVGLTIQASEGVSSLDAFLETLFLFEDCKGKSKRE